MVVSERIWHGRTRRGQEHVCGSIRPKLGGRQRCGRRERIVRVGDAWTTWELSASIGIGLLHHGLMVQHAAKAW